MTLRIEKLRGKLPMPAKSPGRPSLIAGEDEVNLIKALKSGRPHTVTVPRGHKPSYIQRIRTISVEQTGHKVSIRTAETDSPDEVKLIFQGMTDVAPGK